MWLSKLVNSSKFVSLGLFLLSLIAVVKLQQNQYQEVKSAAENPDHLEAEQNLQTKLNLRKLIPSFGFDNLVADSLYLEFTQYYGNKAAREATGYSLVPQYFNAIANRDPLFFDAHVSLSVANSMYAGQAEQTVDLMNQVLKKVPTSKKNIYQIWSLKALDETLFLGDTKAAQYSYQQAISLAEEQGDIYATSAIAVNQQRVEFLATAPDPTAAQIMAWKSVLPNVVKKSERKVIEEKIIALETKLTSRETNLEN